MRLSDQSASYLFLENIGTPMHVVGVSILNGELDLDAVKANVAARLVRVPKYRRRLRFVPFNLAQPVLVDDRDFDIDQHICEHEVQAGASIDDALVLVQELTSRTLPRDRPLWAMHIVRGFGRTLLAHVVHLSLLEGLNLGEDAHVFFDLQRDPPVGPEDDWSPRPAPGGEAMVADAIRDNTAAFGERSRRLRASQEGDEELIRRATESVSRFLTEPVCIAPWNQGLVGTHRLFRHVSVPEIEIRQIRRKLGGTDNDIVLALLAESAARYMQDKGLDVHGEHLRIMCPVKIRREGELGVLESRISGMFPFVDAEPLGILTRLERVRWETESIKQNREAQALQLLSELTPPLPPILDTSGITLPGAEAAISSALNVMAFNPARFFAQFMPKALPMPGTNIFSSLAGFNFSCFNAPGAQTSLFFGGLEVAEQFLMPPLTANLGLGVAVSTYAQTLTFNLNGDAALMSDLDTFAALLREQYDELRTLTVQDAA